MRNYNTNAFTDENETSYYLLGTFMTDGNIQIKGNKKSACLDSKDKDWLEAIRDIICPEMPISNGHYCGRIRIFSKHIVDWLVSKGCTPRKSFTLKFPRIPKKFLPDFIRGVMDGDGSITNNDKTKRCSLTSASKNFITDFIKVIEDKEIKYSYQETKPRTNSIRGRTFISGKKYILSFHGRTASKLLSWAYYPNHKLSLNRKNIKAQEIISIINDNFPGKLMFMGSSQGENNSRSIMTENEIKNILSMWFSIKLEDRKIRGSKSKFFKKISKIYPHCKEGLFRAILNGECWKYVYKEFLKRTA